MTADGRNTSLHLLCLLRRLPKVSGVICRLTERRCGAERGRQRLGGRKRDTAELLCGNCRVQQLFGVAATAVGLCVFVWCCYYFSNWLSASLKATGLLGTLGRRKTA